MRIIPSMARLKYIVVATLADADVVLYNDKEATGLVKNVVLYLAKMDPCYYVAGIAPASLMLAVTLRSPPTTCSKTPLHAEQDGNTRLVR